MKRLFSLLIVNLVTLLIAACGGGGGSAGTPGGSANPANFRVNAPESTTLAIGAKVTYSISGGLAPYLVTNSSPTVATATVVGGNLDITPLRAGTANLSVAPTGGGASFTMVVTVASSVSPLQVQAPDTVTLQAGNSGSYTLLDGAPPYRAVSSAPSVVSASVVGTNLQVVGSALGSATVAVYDSSSSAPVQRTFTVVSTTAFFSTAPAALAMGRGTSRSFTVGGGVAPYYVASSNSAVADASLSGGNLTVVAGATNGAANIVLRDSGGSTVTVAVSVGTNVAFFSNAPDALTIQGGASRAFTLGGGTAPYSVVSANTNVVVATVSGNAVTLVGQNRGTAAVSLKDSLGASISVDVTVDQSSSLAVSAIELTSTLASIRSAGDEATITALVKGASNVGVPNADITFSSDSGILLSPSAQTDASGIATVRLGPGSNRTNRTIVLTARVGTVSQTINIAVVGTTVVVTGTSALQVGATSSPYNVRALDSAGNPISGATLTATSTLSNGLSPSSVTTDLNGNGTINYTPSIAGTDTLVVTGAGASSTPLSISISAVSFDYVALTPAANASFGVNLALASRPEFRVKLMISGAPVTGRTVSFNTTRGALSAMSGTTDAAGEAAVTLNSTSAGPALVTAQVARQAGDPGAGVILASATRTVQFTGVLPASLRLQINPGAIPPNSASSSTNRAEVTATVTDASANPVSGRQVSFAINADPSNGSLSAGLATTDANGIARVEYIAGQQSSPNNGVQISGTVLPVNGDIGVIAQSANLTVNGNSLFITISYGNTIENLNPTTYRKPFSVYVTDATGLAVTNQIINLSVIPTRYYKGVMTWDSVASIWRPTRSVAAGCANEDGNLNGILDAGEDTNGNGSLTPGNVVIASPGAVTTDSSGLASFYLLYGEQFAHWIDVSIVARATVSGTESRRDQVFQLSPLAEDVNQETIPPAGVTSPFGTANACANPN